MTPTTRFVNSGAPLLLLDHPARSLNSILIIYTTCPADKLKFYDPSALGLLLVTIINIVGNHTRVFLNIPMGNAVQVRITSRGRCWYHLEYRLIHRDHALLLYPKGDIGIREKLYDVWSCKLQSDYKLTSKVISADFLLVVVAVTRHIPVDVSKVKILVSSEILIKNCSLFAYSMFCTFSEISIQKGAAGLYDSS